MTTRDYDKEERRKLKERAEEARKNTTSGVNKEGLADKLVRLTAQMGAVAIWLGFTMWPFWLSRESDKIDEKLDSVPDKKKKELVLAYDELLMHNLDSTLAVVPGRELAIEEAHMITWAQAVNGPRQYIDDGRLALMECVDDLSAEEAITFREAQEQYMSSREKMGQHSIGKATVDVYSHRPLYPEELRAEIANKKKELQMANEQTSEQMVNLAQTRTR
ncbi:MAG: hypothetical protein J5895_05640 [Alphaproteobacteria bacterium]|nr:hypothetical protein [Alphaproteobacteria bacterium]